ncbi:MAG: IclR family transcriptional regulator [Deltaproteobacteria bacterium]|nr:IclR family transcriptional regulator [Deltaproteobacteria bacterium]
MRSLERALHLLAVLEEEGWPMGVTELGRASQLSKATVLRILLVLEKYMFVEKKQGRYRLGPAALPLAHAYVLGNDLTRVALPVLQELARSSNETASLFVRMGFKRVAVQRVEGVNPLRFALPIGQRLPLHVGAGKVLAASMSSGELQRWLDELEAAYREKNESFSRQALLDDLDVIRRQGYAVSLGDRLEGAFAITAPVNDANGATMAAVTVSGSADRLTPKKIETLSREVRGAAKSVSERYNGGS